MGQTAGLLAVKATVAVLAECGLTHLAQGKLVKPEKQTKAVEVEVETTQELTEVLVDREL
jgi:hypothetical protein